MPLLLSERWLNLAADFSAAKFSRASPRSVLVLYPLSDTWTLESVRESTHATGVAQGRKIAENS